MRRALVVLILATLPSIVSAQESATGIGVGVSTSRSDANAIAISGQGGRGGRGGNARSSATGGSSTANNGITINTGQGAGGAGTDPNGVTTVRQTGGTASTNRQTGGLRNVPSVFAPGLAAAGLETCLGSVSGGGAFMGGGFSFGTTVPDPGCAARLDARTLWSFGLKKAAVARMCIGADVQRAMPEVCAEYLPGSVPAGYGPGPVATAPGPARLEPAAYDGRRGQVVTVIDRRSGQERACADYDGRRCYRWAR